MEGTNIFKTVELQIVECCKCHIFFAIPKELRQKLLDTHNNFYCPVGHGQHYVIKSDLEKWQEYASSVEKQLKYCKSDKKELFDEIKSYKDRVEKLRTENHGLKIVKSRYKNQLKKLG